jgi:hypothetical protein
MIELSQEGSDTTSIYLTPEQGESLRIAIEQNTKRRFSSYIDSVGLLPSNVYGILAGRRKLSYKTLVRLLSNTTLSAECRIDFIIQKELGNTVPDVTSLNLDDLLFSEDGGELDEVPLTEKDGPLTMLEFLQQNQLED